MRDFYAFIFVIFLGILGIVATFFVGKDAADKKRLRILFILPLFWIYQIAAMYAFGSNAPHNPEWVISSVRYAPVAYLAFAVFSVWRLRGYRLVTVGFCIFNLLLLLFFTFLTGMAVTGAWV